jgi:hypothetical protein
VVEPGDDGGEEATMTKSTTCCIRHCGPRRSAKTRRRSFVGWVENKGSQPSRYKYRYDTVLQVCTVDSHTRMQIGRHVKLSVSWGSHEQSDSAKNWNLDRHFAWLQLSTWDSSAWTPSLA